VVQEKHSYPGTVTSSPVRDPPRAGAHGRPIGRPPEDPVPVHSLLIVWIRGRGSSRRWIGRTATSRVLPGWSG
jgi:hypothetical protein